MADLIVILLATANGLLAGFGFGVLWERRRTDGVPVAQDQPRKEADR